MNTFDLLKEEYRSNGLVLAVGAGVSLGSRLPNWENLLIGLMDRKFHDGEKLFRQLRARGYSLPAIASIIAAACPDGDFTEMLRDELYDKFCYYRKTVRGKDHKEFARYIEDSNPTLCAVAHLCAQGTSQNGKYRPNPLIHAVINFNLDALLQSYVHARFKRRLLRTIERPSAPSQAGKISNFHMHGYFQYDADYIGNPAKESPDVKVLTEQEYFDFFNHPNSMFNYTCLYLLRDYSCLFIGLSMGDDNIRRMLHYSRSERWESYNRESRESLKGPDQEKVLRHFAILRRDGESIIDDLTEKSLERLGTRVIWISEFGEIPDLLGRLKDAGTERNPAKI